VNNSRYVGPGVEVEDDIVRLRRLRQEHESGAEHRTGPWWIKALMLRYAAPLAGDGWPWQR